MSNEIMNTGGAVPDFIKDAKTKGYEEVSDRQGMDEIRISYATSKIVGEGDIAPGQIYNYTTSEDLGVERKYIIVRKRTIFQLSQEDGMGTLCRSYDKETGSIFISDDSEFDDEAQQKLGVSGDDIDNNTRGLTHSCKGCDFHPINGWRRDGDKPIPPRCRQQHQYYVLDITDGVDKKPKLIRITDSSKMKSDVIKELDALMTSKLRSQSAPIFAGVWNFGIKKVENARGLKFPMWDIKFDGYVNNPELFEYADQLYDRLEAKEEELAASAGEKTTKDVTPESEEKAWHGQGGDDEAPF